MGINDLHILTALDFASRTGETQSVQLLKALSENGGYDIGSIQMGVIDCVQILPHDDQNKPLCIIRPKGFLTPKGKAHDAMAEWIDTVGEHTPTLIDIGDNPLHHDNQAMSVFEETTKTMSYVGIAYNRANLLSAKFLFQILRTSRGGSNGVLYQGLGYENDPVEIIANFKAKVY